MVDDYTRDEEDEIEEKNGKFENRSVINWGA